MPARAANFAVVAIAAIAASAQANECNKPDPEKYGDSVNARIEFHTDNFFYLNGCDRRKLNLRFALYN